MLCRSFNRGMMASTVLRMQGVTTGSGGVLSNTSGSLFISCLDKNDGKLSIIQNVLGVDGIDWTYGGLRISRRVKRTVTPWTMELSLSSPLSK